MTEKNKEEYYFLTEKLEEIEWALDGKCNDIDCNKYMYKDLLKKRYRSTLEHNLSCVEHLKRDKTVVMRLLSQKRFRKYRYSKCAVCKKELDKLSDTSKIIGFTRKSEGDNKYYDWKSVRTHKHCAPKFKIPEGWKKSGSKN